MKSVLAATAALIGCAQGIVVFSLSTEPGGKGISKTWGEERWKCFNIVEEGLNNNASFINVQQFSLVNGVQLYDEADCKSEDDSVFIEVGSVNLTDVNFDKKASSFMCL